MSPYLGENLLSQWRYEIRGRHATSRDARTMRGFPDHGAGRRRRGAGLRVEPFAHWPIAINSIALSFQLAWQRIQADTASNIGC